MKKVLVFSMMLAAGASWANIPWQWGFPKPLDPTGAASDESLIPADVDTVTQGMGALAVETEVDSRGLTFDVSQDILLNTKKIVGTILLLK